MYLWDIIVIRRATNALLQERIVVSLLQWMSFYEDAPFYSSASEDLIHGKSEENNLPLLDLVTPQVSDQKDFPWKFQFHFNEIREPSATLNVSFRHEVRSANSIANMDENT